jgi:hypothetical protein
VLAELLAAGMPWALQLLAQLAALHGMPWHVAGTTCLSKALARLHKLLMGDAAALEHQQRLQLVAEAAEGLAAVAAAVATLPSASQLVAAAAAACAELTFLVAGSKGVPDREVRELVFAARPSVVAALRSAAVVVATRGPSHELYSGLWAVLERLSYEYLDHENGWSPWGLQYLQQEGWGLQLLAELQPVLLPAVLLQRSMPERRGLPGRQEAEKLAAAAIKYVTLGSEEGERMVKAAAPELRLALLPYALHNPWLPQAAGRAVRLLAERFPGCLAQPVREGGPPLLEELVGADASFAALPDIFYRLWGARPELLEPLLRAQSLPEGCLFDCPEIWRLHKTSRRAYSSWGMGGSCGDALWVVLPICW